MQRIPIASGWTSQEPGWPVTDDEDDEYVSFGEPPASPDPSSLSSPPTSCYEITASGVISESTSIPTSELTSARASASTSGLPTPPPPAHAPLFPVADIIRAAARRLQEEAAQAAAHAAAQAAAHAAAQAATSPRRSTRIRERAEREEAAAAIVSAHARLRRTPQRVAKMSTGGVRKN